MLTVTADVSTDDDNVTTLTQKVFRLKGQWKKNYSASKELKKVKEKLDDRTLQASSSCAIQPGHHLADS